MTVALPTSSSETTAQTNPATLHLTLAPVPGPLLRWLTLGVAGTVLFLVIYVVEGATRPHYNAWQQTISSLSFGPLGWIQRADFLLCGASVLLLALVWRRILRGGVGGLWYPMIHGIEGLGLLGVGIFIYDPVHTACLILIVAAMSLSLLVIAWRFWRTPNWRRWGVFSLVCGLWPNVVMPFFIIGLYGHTALSPYAGLFERLATSPDIVWGVALLIPLWAGRRLLALPGEPGKAAARQAEA